MRIKKARSNIAEGDLTPMIDMTFQLIAFFMVLINFTEAEQDDRVTLPQSVLAKPPEAAVEDPITIHVTNDGDAIFGGELVTDDVLRRLLKRESEVLSLSKKSTSDATVIIRASSQAATGRVQELIQLCQKEKFEKFALRAKEQVD
jgi:biopolymer transport protein ExbD